jgi:phosphatidylglycerol:prolipoprotein diacylglycerol transferase
MLQWFHNFSPQPILFHWGWLTVYYYGLLVALGIVVGGLVVARLAKKQDWPSAVGDNLLFWGLVGGLIGARLYHVFLEWPYYRQNLLAIFEIWNGGLAIHGAWLGGLVAIYFVCRRHRLSFPKTLDVLAIGLILGQAIGRWGNFFNQELFGRPTNLPWGIFIDWANRPAEYLSVSYFHPTFLYESGLDLILFFLLFFFFSRIKQLAGLTISLYLVGYSLIRFLLEFVRIDDTPEIWGWRWPQWFSLFIIVLVAVYWLWRWYHLSNSRKSV